MSDPHASTSKSATSSPPAIVTDDISLPAEPPPHTKLPFPSPSRTIPAFLDVSSPTRSGSRTRAPSIASQRSITSTSASRIPSISRSVIDKGGKARVGDNTVTRLEGGDDGVEGEIYRPIGGADARKGLRRLVTSLDVVDRKGKSPVRTPQAEFPELSAGQTKAVIESSDYPPRRYYILTNAGKPVFCSHIEEEGDGTTNLMGVVQALVSIVAEEDDKIRYIQRGKMKISFLLRSPLYIFCISEWGEPEFVLRSQMEYLYLQVLSVVTISQLNKLFQRRSNFDLRRLVEGTDAFSIALLNNMQTDFTYLTSTLQPLRMSASLRDAAASALVPPSKINDLLYVLLVADGKIVTLLRPRKHSIHPSDLHLLLNMLTTSPALRTQETWLPICLPKFNPDGFVYTFISYPRTEVGLVFLSADREGFVELREWKETVLASLESEKVLQRIEEALQSHPYSVADVGFPGLLHFVCKSRTNVQITSPQWESPYAEDSPDRNRLITLYQHLYDNIHARSGQAGPLKLIYARTKHEICLGWITQVFEIYLTISPNLPKSAAVGAANAVARWVAKEQNRLFLREAPVF